MLSYRRYCFLGLFVCLGLVGQAAAATTDDADDEQSSFPRIIIQTSPKNNGRADWDFYQLALKEKNPGFKNLHFDDDQALAFIEQHFSGTLLHHTYLEVTPIMKADLFRLAAVYVLGGFYMDMDVLAKQSFEPLVDMLSGSSEEPTKYYGAVFPKEWWMSNSAYTSTFPGRKPQDPEDHWQVGNYAFGARPQHPFVKDVLEETIVRSIRLMQNKREEDITDVDILATTGPYTLTEVFHRGRKEGMYADVLHIRGDSSEPVHERTHGGNDWHKFGPYAEHMLTHSWVKTSRNMQEYGGTYGVDDTYGVTNGGVDDGTDGDIGGTSGGMIAYQAAGAAAVFSSLVAALMCYIV